MAQAIPGASEWLYIRLEMETLWSSICIPLSWPINTIALHGQFGQQRLRFTTTPRPGATPDSDETRLVYPCYCYKPNPEGLATATPVEQRMVETKDIFFLNK
ncbi:uncharacterized protein Dyak_GE11563, isoform B [Drosophila yakuba]|uniref:Uncharacterized protein, isoform B n=1 Tax=Drosophila yakuba TaxID=7245 RepID=A0A0R1DU68_DROYA|nr:uncharacterized protein Dyak_GE11563, isoform B [Drosophila yakuba]